MKDLVISFLISDLIIFVLAALIIFCYRLIKGFATKRRSYLMIEENIQNIMYELSELVKMYENDRKDYKDSLKGLRSKDNEILTRIDSIRK